MNRSKNHKITEKDVKSSYRKSSISGQLITKESRELGRRVESKHDQVDKYYQEILDSIIDERYLRENCGLSDPKTATSIHLLIDSAHQSIFEIHNVMPCLESLVLDNSKISSIRDLGIGLRNIRHLSLFGCGLHDLDGIGVLTGLEELNVEENYLSDLCPLAMHENLKVRSMSALCTFGF
jgi:Leucine-rich repeat (LRR) protein